VILQSRSDKVTRRQGDKVTLAHRRVLAFFFTLSPLHLVTLSSALPGCIGAPANPSIKQPTTKVDPNRAQQWYWYNRPATVAVDYPQFDPLWRAAGEAVRDAGYIPDRRDFRNGVMTTKPLVSQQIFEPWRHDTASFAAVAQSSLQTVRRTVRFEFARKEDGTFELTPKVIIERYSFGEHRITSAEQYREIFQLTREEAFRRRDLQENPTQEVSGIPPPEYWYAIGRDPDMERRLAEWVRDKLQSDHRPKVVVTLAPATQPNGS
jgi:hypothetical protein